MRPSADLTKMLGVMLILASAVFAYWSESTDVAVIDQIGRPISNANVTVVYQSTKCNYHEQITHQTDNNGRTHFEFVNTIDETAVTTDCVEREYTITAIYGGISNSTTGDVNNTNELYVIPLPVVYYTIRIVDSNDNPITDASVVYQGSNYRADMRGTVNLPVPIGKDQKASIVFGSISREIRIYAFADASQTVKLPVYDLKIKVFNEYGLRLPAIVRVDGMSAQATELTDAVFEKFSYETAHINVTVEDRTKSFEVKIVNDTVNVYFDFSPPVIRDLKSEVVERGNVKISAAIVDEGTHAAGITENPLAYYATDENFTNFTETKMYPMGSDSYYVVLPSRGANVKFIINATDTQGNIGSYEGKYLFKEEKIEEKPVTIEQISITHIIGLIAFVVIVIFVYQKIREQF